MSPTDIDQDPFEALRRRIRDVQPPTGMTRADWQVDVDTLLGLHARWLFDHIRRGVRSRPAVFPSHRGPDDEVDALTVGELHDLLDDELARHP